MVSEKDKVKLVGRSKIYTMKDIMIEYDCDMEKAKDLVTAFLWSGSATIVKEDTKPAQESEFMIITGNDRNLSRKEILDKEKRIKEFFENKR